MVKIAVLADTAGELEKAHGLAGRLGLPLAGEEGGDFPLRLVVTGRRLELRGNSLGGPLFVDFAGAGMAHRRREAGGREELARAVASRGRLPAEVIDATAGLGRDAFILAALGVRVRMCERNPVIAALLADGLQRAALEPELARIVERMDLRVIDSREGVRELSRHRSVPVIYLDPMYPHRRKTALVKKEMRYLRGVVGGDEDAAELLGLALDCARKRVVVKRPASSPPMGGLKPDFSRKTRHNRFDVYLLNP